MKSKRKLMNASNVIVGLWVMAMFTIFPLIYNDFYFDILQTKYYTVLTLSIIMILALIVICGFAGGFKNFFDNLNKKGFAVWFKEEFSIWDICILVFWLMSALSTAFAGRFVMESITGDKGRYSGLLLISIYVIIYFTVSRMFSFSKVYFTVFLAVSIPVCLFGYTDYFNMDILGFKEKISPEQWPIFTSTIGNINTYTAVLAFYIAIAGTLFITTPFKSDNGRGESIGKIAFYYVIMLMNFIALTMGTSDNGYLTLAAFFGIVPFVAFRTMEGVRRFVLTIFTYLLGIKIIQLINISYAGKVLGISGLFDFISDFKYLDLVIVAFAIIVIIMYVLEYRKKEKRRDNEALLRSLRYIWLAILVIIFAAIVFMGMKINSDVTAAKEKYGALADYFVFNDSWGTFRGYIWRAAVEEYMKFPLLHKIFGSGPDTFGLYIGLLRNEEMTSVTGQFFDATHNEYIQFLFTLGPIATIAYILALILPSVEALRTRLFYLRDNTMLPYLYACAIAVICYATQAVVNLNLPVVTPFLWIFLSIMVAILRDKGEVING
ncbi:beta-carotene 15,15'-monooxygenase [Lachnoanaerobaculum gingivalis]|uniref:Beta-carotene 15,15'-monooxygenase n=1 Tax=Lachnoanaerobaculum gingivalis TaxID=2490855 RepID=A0A3P3QWD1_9FIRM|nr:O-antigen ligase family protein [Lachnoanaerobaculum gingivalis]RRJ25018.1 beta-carotene 15,15'-monooxygenase [Lachnoanaerobaculum gingivalis]